MQKTPPSPVVFPAPKILFQLIPQKKIKVNKKSKNRLIKVKAKNRQGGRIAPEGRRQDAAVSIAIRLWRIDGFCHRQNPRPKTGKEAVAGAAGPAWRPATIVS
jgi:hypothetical protein